MTSAQGAPVRRTATPRPLSLSPGRRSHVRVRLSRAAPLCRRRGAVVAGLVMHGARKERHIAEVHCLALVASTLRAEGARRYTLHRFLTRAMCVCMHVGAVERGAALLGPGAIARVKQQGERQTRAPRLGTGGGGSDRERPPDDRTGLSQYLLRDPRLYVFRPRHGD